MKALRNTVAISLTVWFVIFFLALLPYAGLQAHKIKARPHVPGMFSSYRVVPGPKGTKFVVAALDFDRPSSEGPVHCHFDQYLLGPVDRESSNRLGAEFAVRMDSCAEAVELPVAGPDNLTDWIQLFVDGSAFAAIFGCAFSLVVLYGLSKRRKFPPVSAAAP